MKRLTYILAATCLIACSGHHDDHNEHAHHEHEHQHAPKAVAQEHNHSDEFIELAESQATRLGVKYETVRAGNFASVLHASGIIERASCCNSTASAPTSGIIRFLPGISMGAAVKAGSTIATIDASTVSGGDSNRAALATLEAARRELERIEPLYKQNLATQAEYNAALAAVNQAEAAYSPAASAGKIIAPSSGVITSLNVDNGAHVNTGDDVATIADNTHLTLHAEVPASNFAALNSITDARIGSFTLSENKGRRTGINAENGYACIYFSFNNDGSILPGTGANVFLLGSPRSGVISVPTSAIIEQQGEYFVYIRCYAGHYQKLAVTLGESDGVRTEITHGLNEGIDVVTQGAMTVRLAENSGEIPHGHSHAH